MNKLHFFNTSLHHFALRILCLSLAVFGVNEAWGAYRTTVYVNSSPATGGYVYIGTSSSCGESSCTKASDDAVQGKDGFKTKGTFTWYFCHKTSANYTFKGWTTDQSANVGDGVSSNPWVKDLEATISASSITGGNSYTYYAIFARMTADQSSIAYGAKNVDEDNTATVKLTTVHAGDVNISLINNNSGYFSIDGGGEYSSVQNEETKTITVHYLPKAAGSHSATLQITGSNGMTTINIPLSGSAKSQAKMSWNPNTNVMNAGDIFTEEALNYSDQTRNIVFTTSDAAIIKINDDGYPEAVSEGKATITATQEETTEFYETKSAQEITVTNKQKQLIEWTDKLSFKYEGSQFTQTLTASANTNITYSLSDVTNNCVSLSGNVLTITNYGTAYVTATAAETDEYIGVSMTRKVIIRDPDAACETIIYGPSAEHEFDLGWNAASHKTLTSEIDFGGQEPRYVNFDYKGKSHNVLIEYYTGTLRIDQYVNGAWQEVKNLGQPTKNGNYVNTGNIALSRNATKMRVRAEDGMGYMYYKDLTVVLAKYLEVSTDALSFDGQVGISQTKTFNVNYSDVQGPIEITSSKSDIFTFSPSSIDVDCEQHGTKQVTVTLNSKTEIKAISETITISNGVEPVQTITVSGKVTKRKQDIKWNDATTYNSTDKPTLSATATSELPISSYSSDNESIAKVVNGNQLEFYSSGKVNITAHQDGNDFYDPASLTKEFTISKVTPTIVTLPTVGNAITYGSKLSDATLTGGSAKDDKDNIVAGHFVWTSPDEIPHGGQQQYTVRFVPNNTNMYTSDAVSAQTLAIMVTKANQTLTWDAEQIKIRKEDGDYTLNASSTSGRVITYTLSDPTLATINGNILTPLKSGDCTITAICPADNDYNESNSIEKQLFIAGPDEITWKYKDGDHVWAGRNLNDKGTLATAHTPVWYGTDQTQAYITVNNNTDPKTVYTAHAAEGVLVEINGLTEGDEYYSQVSSAIHVYIDSCYQALNWEQSFLSYLADAQGHIDETIPLTAYAIDSMNQKTNLPVIYAVDNTDVAEITGNATDGWNLHIKGAGTAILKAHVAPTDIYMSVVETRDIIVRKEGEPCGSYALISTGEKKISDINDNTYIFDVPGETLTFKTRKYSILTLNANVTVEGYNIKESAWQNIDKYNLDFTDKQTKSYTISEDIRKIRMYTDADLENSYRYISDLYITQKSYLRSSITEINEIIYINQDFEHKFTVDYSDKPYISCSIDNNQLEILRDDNDNSCGEYGTITFTVKSKDKWYTPTEINATITLSTAVGDNIIIPVHIKADLGGFYKFVNASGDGKWDNPQNWLYGGSPAISLPERMNQVQIIHPVRITEEVSVYELEVEADAMAGEDGYVTIAPTGGITVYNGGVKGIDGKLTIESSQSSQGYFRVLPDVVNSWTTMPTATVQYATKASINTGANHDATWQYFGVAVENASTEDCQNLYEWNEKTGWVKANSLQPFHGYVMTQYGVPTFYFTGKLMMQNYDIPLYFSADGTQGSNIIANSFPAPIDVKNFTDDDFEGDVLQTFYLFNSGSWNQWKQNRDSISLSGDNDDTPGTYYAIPVGSAKYLDNSYQTIIPSMSGIYVITESDNAQIHFNYAKHVWNAQDSNMNRPLRAPHRSAESDTEGFALPLDTIEKDTVNYAQQLSHRVVLNIDSKESGCDRVCLLEHKQDAHFTPAYDNGFDAYKMDIQGIANIYATETDGKMAISATDSFNGTFIGVMAGKDHEYTLTVKSVIGSNLTLKDLETNISIPLVEGQTYTFNMAANSTNDARFMIIETQTPSVTTGNATPSGNFTIWADAANLHIAGDIQNTPVYLYTVDGQLIETSTIHSNCTLPIQHLASGIYLIKVNNTTTKFIKK